MFVAHAPERIAAGRFLEEIETLPCIIGGAGARSGEVAGELFGVFGAPIVQTTPVQAELAKIWTNILRYTNFALPNLLMMDCERHDANVFEVIDLINRDYPRGGIARPGFTAGTCLRKDFAFSEERSAAPGMLLAVSRVNESVPLFLLEGMRRRVGALADRRVAVLGLAFKADTDDERDSLSHKLIRMLERELADVAVHDPHVATPTVSLQDALDGADAVIVATNHAEFREPQHARRDRRARGERLPGGRPVGLLGRRAGVRVRLGARRRSVAAREPRARHRAAPARSARPSSGACSPTPPTRCASSDQRPAPHWMREGCEVHTGDLRAREQARAATRGCTHVIHLAAIVGGIANFHKLPHTLTEVNNALYNGVIGAALDARGGALRLRLLLDGVRARRAVPHARGLPARAAQRRCRPTASPSSRARSTAAPRTRSTACRSRSAGRSTPTAPASCPTPSRASRTPCPT